MKLSINFELKKGINFKLDMDLISGIMTMTDNDGLVNQEKFEIKDSIGLATAYIQTPIKEFLKD